MTAFHFFFPNVWDHLLREIEVNIRISCWREEFPLKTNGKALDKTPP